MDLDFKKLSIIVFILFIFFFCVSLISGTFLYSQEISPIRFEYKAEAYKFCKDYSISNYSIIQDSPNTFKLKSGVDTFTFKENSFEIKVFKNDAFYKMFFVNRFFIFNTPYFRY